MINKLKIISFTYVSALMCAILAACAPPPAELPKDLVWPLPPDKPRIRWVGSYAVARDVEERSSFIESLVGSEAGDGLSRPQGVAVDSAGSIYVADTVRSRVSVFDIAGKKFRIAGGNAQERPAMPVGLAIAHRSNILLVACVGSKKVIAYDLVSGNIRFIIGQEPGFFGKPVGVAVDEDRGIIYVTDSKRSELKSFDMTGKYVSTLATAGSQDKEVYIPAQVFVDKTGKIYVADTMNFKVKIFSPDGSLVRVIGGIGDSFGKFSRPYGVAVDSEGHIYAADANFANIQIFDQQGRILLTFGSAGMRPGLFSAPMYLWVDKDDKIYVADSLNARVQVFQYLREQESGDSIQKPADKKPDTGVGSQKSEEKKQNTEGGVQKPEGEIKK